MNLVSDILAALAGEFAGGPTQHQRLLRLHTPLGADVLLAERLDGIEAVGAGGDVRGPRAGLRFTVHALSTNVHLDLKALIGQPALLELQTQLSRSALRPWHGHITEAALEGSDGGLARYRLVIEPWLAFLAHTQDSWVFQDMSVPQILDDIFAGYQSQGRLAPAWRWDLADDSVYPRRSLCIQYQESDLAFVQRLMREEGLFGWFEHQGAPGDDSLGQHTLVIADHNGAFRPNPQPRVRYTQSGASLAEDSLIRWQRRASVRAARVALVSPDYRAGPQDLRPVEAQASAPLPALAVYDAPGQYAYEDAGQGERLARRQIEALDAWRDQAQARGPWRSAAPGTTFTLADHPVHTGVPGGLDGGLHGGLDSERDRFAVLQVRHLARNNLRADAKAALDSLLGALKAPERGLANSRDEPLYEAELIVQSAATPVRPAVNVADEDEYGKPDPRLHRRPTVHGTQTALVVGLGQPIHTDRDHRIKVQFHWQRGDRASQRLSHPAGDNAPASDASGTWVRVAEAIAGANWGAHFTPRVGQEVLVGFVAGDIDRPVVLGSVYNGQGPVDAQGNQRAAGSAGATGNAPAWFPGSQAEGRLQAHQHPAVLSGHKSQEFGSSASGQGGYNQLVFDDSPGQGRIELCTTSAQTWLQLGHLLNQNDNRRLHPRGHGLDLATQAWGAVRAGSGLLISAHGKPASTAAAAQMDTREPQNQLQQATELAHTLAESAQAHQAKLQHEHDTVGAKQADTARKLPYEQGLYASQNSLAQTQTQGDADRAIDGGAGTVAVLGRPDLVLAAPAGIAAFTPAHAIASGGNTASFVAGQDVQHLAQSNHATAAKDGLVFYTYGLAQNPNKPNAETGIRWHAATGSVSTQSQSGATQLTADKRIEVASTQGLVRVTAPEHVLLTAGGAAIRIEGGDITLSGPGSVDFRAGMKELGGPKSASLPALNFPRAPLDIKRTALFPVSL